jgi:diguanylate cyclase (GGDEF)-like protein
MGTIFPAVRRRGKIVFNNRRSIAECRVSGLSDVGATIEVESARSLPAQFELLLNGEATARVCAVREVKDEQLSIVFVRAAAQGDKRPTFGRKRQRKEGEEAAPLAFLNQADFGLAIVETDGRVSFFNDTFLKLWQLPEGARQGEPALRDLLRQSAFAQTVTVFIERIVSQLDGPHAKPVDVRISKKEVIRCRCAALPSGRAMMTFTLVTDFTQRFDQLEAMRAALDVIDQGVVIMDRELVVQFINKRAREQWHLKQAQAELKQPYAELLSTIAASGAFDVPEQELEEFILMRYATVQSGNPVPVEMRLSSGRSIRAQCTILPGDGRMVSETDVTDIVERAEQHEHHANSDPLTGVCNRRSFFRLADMEWERFCRYGQPFCLLAFDIANIKSINATMGRDAGDRALQQIARVCEAEKRFSDTVARIGGDQFMLLMPATTASLACRFAERLRAAVAESPLEPEKEKLAVNIAIAEATADLGSVSELIRLADERLHDTKEQSRNRPAEGSPGRGRSSAAGPAA